MATRRQHQRRDPRTGRVVQVRAHQVRTHQSDEPSHVSYLPAVDIDPLATDPHHPLGSLERPPPIIDEAAVDRFTTGQCHALALVLHARTGWPIYWTGRSDCPHLHPSDSCLHLSMDACACQLDHLVVRRPDGDVVDIRGPRGVEELFLEREEYETLEPIGPALVERLVDAGWEQPDLDHAASFATPVLDLQDCWTPPWGDVSHLPE